MDKDTAMVSFVAYESSQTRLENIIRKLTLTLVVFVILMFTSNMVWLYAWVHNSSPESFTAVHQEKSVDVKASNEGMEEERKKQSICVNTIRRVRLDYDNMSRTEIEELIHEYIFSERDRKIISRRLLDGITLEALAEEFDLSVSQIKNIVRKCQKRLFL